MAQRQPTKRERQKERRAAQRAAVLAARKRRARRRVAARIVLLAVVVAGIVAGIMALVGDDDQEVATENTTTTAPVTESAAGKPCVPMAGTPPAGAPAVPVKEGPPPTELVKEDLRAGTGAAVTPTSTVTVHYIGVACSTGRIFDSSYGRGQPATFPLNQVIKGWQDGLQGMNVGGQRLLGIPPDQAYGRTGSPPDIAPDEALWFVVEVVNVS